MKHDFYRDSAGDLCFDLHIKHAGSFEYFVSFPDSVPVYGYFIVDPTLKDIKTGNVLSLDSICLLTVVPKWYVKVQLIWLYCQAGSDFWMETSFRQIYRYWIQYGSFCTFTEARHFKFSVLY